METTMPSDTDARDALLLAIAKRHTGFETLATRNSDSLDFREVCAEGLRRALADAYEAGRAAESDDRSGGTAAEREAPRWDPRQAVREIASQQSELALVMEQAAEQARVLNERISRLVAKAKAELSSKDATDADFSAFIGGLSLCRVDTGDFDSSFVDLLESRGPAVYPPVWDAKRVRWAVVPR